jgi:hypothetical protein
VGNVETYTRSIYYLNIFFVIGDVDNLDAALRGYLIILIIRRKLSYVIFLVFFIFYSKKVLLLKRKESIS